MPLCHRVLFHLLKCWTDIGHILRVKQYEYDVIIDSTLNTDLDLLAEIELAQRVDDGIATSLVTCTGR